jgi:hypothetical protein
MLEKLQTKQCLKCKKILPLSEFFVHRSGRNIGRPVSQCRTCSLATLRQWRDAHPDFKRASTAEYQRTRWRTHQPKKFLPHVKRVEDIRGQVFGNYTVLEFAGLAPTNRVSKWLCRCACGAEHVVFKTAAHGTGTGGTGDAAEKMCFIFPIRQHCPNLNHSDPFTALFTARGIPTLWSVHLAYPECGRLTN